MDDDDLYGAGGDTSEPTPDPMDKSDQEEPMSEPQLVNKELCEDCKPGEKLIVEVIADHGKELEIRYVGKQEDKEDDMPPGEMPAEMEPVESSGMMD
jgi:hypothetical protein